MKNLMNYVSDMVSGSLLDQVADLIGTDKSSTQSAISKFAPVIIGGLISKGDTVSGAQTLIDVFKRNNYGESNLANLGSILGDKEKSANFLNDGMGMADMIFGNNMGSVLDKLINLSGVGRATGSTLLKFLAPLIINGLAGKISSNNWGASKLTEYLVGQKSDVMSLIPGMSSLLGFSASDAKRTSTRSTTSHADNNERGGGMGWLKWLLPLLLIGALLYMFSKNGCSSERAETTETEIVDVDTHEGHTHDGADHSHNKTVGVDNTVSSSDIDFSKYKVLTNGNIVDGNGRVVLNAGSYDLDRTGNVVDNNGRIIIPAAKVTSSMKANLSSYLGKYAGVKLKLDANGNLVDETGKIIFKSGDYEVKNGFYYDKQGNKLGRTWDKIVKAVSNAAEKTVDGMKNLFSGMFSKKEGMSTTYLLNDIVFDKENHRITNFSKAEVEGLAAALKANKDSKISVNVYTDDAGKDKANEKLSKTRAEVVTSMLVTLGVDKGQISFDGKGNSDAAKAAEDRVEIAVK